MTDNKQQEREPQSKDEVMARCKWRGAIGNEYDREFWQHFDSLPASKRADFDGITTAALQAKPNILGARSLDADLEAAKRDFIAGAGTPDEWAGMKTEVRHELLKKRALGEGRTLAHDEMERRAAATGHTVWNPHDA